VLRFKRGHVGAGELQRYVDSIVSELETVGSESNMKARAAGLGNTELHNVSVKLSEKVEPNETTAIVVSLATAVSTRVAQTLWLKVISPLLAARFGAAALGRKL
jgi:hypothetical protein